MVSVSFLMQREYAELGRPISLTSMLPVQPDQLMSMRGIDEREKQTDDILFHVSKPYGHVMCTKNIF